MTAINVVENAIYVEQCLGEDRVSCYICSSPFMASESCAACMPSFFYLSEESKDKIYGIIMKE